MRARREAILLITAFAACAGPTKGTNRGILLEELTWLEAESILTPEAVVVFALGAESKEHGPHLRLKNDWLIAEYLKRRVLESSKVVVAPTIPFHYFPAFVEYPGSISLRLETARDVIIDLVESLSRFGPKRFYVINTGVSTNKALAPAREALAAKGILLRYTNLLTVMTPIEKELREQEGGTHADEIETSMMLYIAPETVDMTKAVKDYHPDGGRLTRTASAAGTYSPTGIWGDPTLATRAKGERLVEHLVRAISSEIEAVRTSTLPISVAE
jgi:creatinine amidohydrolase